MSSLWGVAPAHLGNGPTHFPHHSTSIMERWHHTGLMQHLPQQPLPIWKVSVSKTPMRPLPALHGIASSSDGVHGARTNIALSCGEYSL